MAIDFISSEQSYVLGQLSKEWKNNSSRLVTFQGNPGIGKRTLSQRVSAQFRGEVLSVSIEPNSHDQFQTFILDLAFSLECIGESDLSALIESGEISNPVQELVKLLTKKNFLVIVEGFESVLDGRGLVHSRPMSKFLEMIVKSHRLKAKIILIANQRISESGWAARAMHFHLKGFQPQEAQAYLENALKQEKLIEKVPKDRFSEIVARLAMNPRAINTFVYSGLVYESLDTLISLVPGLFQPGDVSMNSRLVEELESAIFYRALQRISTIHRKVINYISVYRRPFSQEVYKSIPIKDSNISIDEVRRELQQLYFIENKLGDSLNPLLREICLTQFREQHDDWEHAQGIAADHQLSKFKASNKSTAYKLAGSYSELRHHLLESSRMQELSKVSSRFAKYICSQITKPQQSQIPPSRDILEERIYLISALPEENISSGLFYHLALCLKERAFKGDFDTALGYARKAQSKNIYYAYWLLRLDLEYEVGGIEEAECAFNSYRKIEAGNGKDASIYLRYASLQKKDGQDQNAARTLLEGTKVVQPSSLTEIAPQCAKYLEDIGKTEEAICVLQKSIATPGVSRKASLYSVCSKLLSKTKQHDQAKDMLRLAISDPFTSKIYALQVSYAEICCEQNRDQEAIEYLQEAIALNQRDDLFELYRLCARLMVKNKRFDDATELLKNGIKSGRVKDLANLYLSISKNIEQTADENEAVEFLERALRSKACKDPTQLYARCAEIYFRQRKIKSSKDVLERAIADTNILDKWMFYKGCADRYFRLGSSDKAIEILSDAVDDPNCSSVYVMYLEGAKIYEKSGQLSDAIAFVEDGLNKAASRDKGAIYLKYAELLDKNGEVKKSITTLMASIHEPGITRRWELYKSCAEYLVKDGRPNDAIELLERAVIEVKGGNVAEIYNLYAKTLISHNRKAEAHFVLEEALSKFSGNKGLTWTSDKLKSCEELYKLCYEGTLEEKNTTTFEETRSKLQFFKRKVENEDCYRVFYNDKNERDSGEKHAHYLFKMVWEKSPSTVNAEVNNGRGPVDFQITRGKKDTTLVEFKLAGSSSLEQNLENQTPIYAQANATKNYFTVVIFFTDKEGAKVQNLFENRTDIDQERLFLIDARPKVSASKVRS